jgi:UDP-2,4-diacetamido-2,4,6-trideoxy-beta-L-altropyranose hydrolase
MEFRTISADDIDLIFDWANDPDSRRNSFNPKPITHDEHGIWFRRKLQDKNCLYLIGLVDDVPAGQVRLDVDNDRGTISFSVAKDFRGKGYSTELLLGITQYAAKHFCNLATIIGKVKRENIASRKEFLRAGFSEEVLDDTYIYSMEVASEGH